MKIELENEFCIYCRQIIGRCDCTKQVKKYTKIQSFSKKYFNIIPSDYSYKKYFETGEQIVKIGNKIKKVKLRIYSDHLEIIKTASIFTILKQNIRIFICTLCFVLFFREYKFIKYRED